MDLVASQLLRNAIASRGMNPQAGIRLAGIIAGCSPDEIDATLAAEIVGDPDFTPEKAKEVGEQMRAEREQRLAEAIKFRHYGGER